MEYGPPPLFRQGLSARIRFIVYVLVSVVLILVDGRLRTLDSFRSTAVSFTTPLYQFVQWPFQAIKASEGYFVSKVRLKTENDVLKTENEHLLTELARFRTLQEDNARLRALLGAVKPVNNQIATAEVIGQMPDRFTRRILINAGDKDGLRPGMAVLAPGGVLGQVARTVAHQAEVTLLTDHRQRLAVINQRTGKLYVLTGSGEDLLDLSFVLPEDDIQVGDTLVTSGKDHLFPRAVAAGTVTATSHAPGETYQNVTVKPSANLTNVQFAAIILNPPTVDPALTKTEDTTNRRRGRH